jgi:hypothetical protein
MAEQRRLGAGKPHRLAMDDPAQAAVGRAPDGVFQADDENRPVGTNRRGSERHALGLSAETG